MTEKSYASPLIRWSVLLLVSITIATNYYVYDALSSIKSVMQAQLGFSSTEYGWIVSFYSFPNTFFLMAIFGGMILDRWGIRKTGFLFVGFCVLGAFITAYGASSTFLSGGPGYSFMNSFLKEFSPQLKLMMFGRLLFGLGAETSIIVTNKVLVKWFKGKELALAFAVNISLARIGTAAALIASPILIQSPSGWTNAIWVAAVLMGIGFLFFIIYMIFDAKPERLGNSTLSSEPEEKFRLKDFVLLLKTPSFLYICLLCVTFYSAVFPFQAYCPDMLHNKFGVSIENSGLLSSLIIWGTIIFTPLFGLFVDKKGKRATLMIGGSLLLTVVHLTLSLTNITPYISMFIMGIAFSLVPAAMWPSVAVIVEEKRLGTAFGIMTSIQNLGLWAFPILAGMLLDYTNRNIPKALLDSGKASLDYTYTILMFALLGVIGFVFALLLKSSDRKYSGGNLEKMTMH
ncbi:MAG: hypothetical protein HW421_292 [Ignavibacteria bacterium]|nr:hypothetical protein [Ignavibacteria bacterium]